MTCLLGNLLQFTAEHMLLRQESRQQRICMKLQTIALFRSFKPDISSDTSITSSLDDEWKVMFYVVYRQKQCCILDCCHDNTANIFCYRTYCSKSCCVILWFALRQRVFVSWTVLTLVGCFRYCCRRNSMNGQYEHEMRS